MRVILNKKFISYSALMQYVVANTFTQMVLIRDSDVKMWANLISNIMIMQLSCISMLIIKII